MPPTVADIPCEIDGTRVLAREYAGASNPPVVLLHGLAISGAYFWPLAEQLAPEHRVLVPDLPGTGRSGDAPGPPEVAALAEWLAEWMDAMELDAAVFVANSFGCQVAAELAARHPERVRGMVWLGPAVDASAGVLRQLLRLAATALLEPPRLVLRFLVDVFRYGIPRAVATFFRALRHPFLDRLAAVRAPVLIVRGRHDLLVRRRFAEALAAGLPRGTYLEVPGAHAVHFEDPARLADRIRPFLEGREGG